MMVIAMHRRAESRGGHARTDCPERVASLARRSVLTWEQARAAARRIGRIPAASMQA
jgi:aspartate oxidase